METGSNPRHRTAGQPTKLAAAAALAIASASAGADWYFKVKNECSIPLTLYARVELPWIGWTTLGPIHYATGERKYLAYKGRDLESRNPNFYLFAHVQGNPDVVVLRGQPADPADRTYAVFGYNRRFEHIRDEARLYATDVWIHCDQMVFDGVPARSRPAGGDGKPLPKPVTANPRR